MHDLQDGDLCTPNGRDCVVKEASATYNCPTSCEGIHSDIQWQDEAVGKSRDGGKEKNKEAFDELMKEYKEFKRNYSRNFRFDAKQDLSWDHGIMGDHKLYGKLRIFLTALYLVICSSVPGICCDWSRKIFITCVNFSEKKMQMVQKATKT